MTVSLPSTDSRLLDVAVDHFGRLGLSGASTRAIARDAGTPMSSITYHFGGKEGLYLAAADHIAALMRERMGPAIAAAETLCGPDGSIADARAAIHRLLDSLAEMMLRDDAAAISRFIIREQADPTEAFNRIYEGVMGRMLDRVGGLLQHVSGGRLDAAEARVRTLTIAGQVLFFRIARATLMKGLGWDKLNAERVAIIKATVAANLDAIFDTLQPGDAP